MVIVSSIFSAGSFLGSLLTNFLIDFMSHITVMILVQAAIFICFVFSVLVLENIKPEKLIDEEEKEEEAQGYANVEEAQESQRSQSLEESQAYPRRLEEPSK